MLLEIKDLSVSFKDDDGVVANVVDCVNLSLERGEILGVVGESGCGKSATAMSVARLLPMPPAFYPSGSILLDGRDTLTMRLEELRALRGKKIGVIFQDPMNSLSPLHRIGDQLVETILLHEQINKAAAKQLACEWLAKVGIPEPEVRMRAYPFELSGGMQQRVMIAMALMLEPDLVIADEPTTALDVTIQAQILRLMKTLHRKNSGVLLITHDMGVVSQMATKIAVMYAGRIVETAPAHEFFANPSHPYSQALLKAIPSAATRGKPLAAIPGNVPAADSFVAGCRFHERCSFAKDSCLLDNSQFFEVSASHYVRCPFTKSR